MATMDDIQKAILDFRTQAVKDSGDNIFATTILECVNALIVDMGDGLILFSTPGVNTLFGYLKGELDGKNIIDLMPDRFRGNHGDHLKKFSDNPTPRAMGESKMKLIGIKRNLDEFPIRIGLHPTMVGRKRVAVATILSGSDFSNEHDIINNSV